MIFENKKEDVPVAAANAVGVDGAGTSNEVTAPNPAHNPGYVSVKFTHY